MLISYNQVLAPAVETCATIRSTGVTRDRLRISQVRNPRNEIGVNFASPLSGCRVCFFQPRLGDSVGVRGSRRKNSLALVSIQSFPSPLLSVHPSNVSTMKSFGISVLHAVKLGIGTRLTALRCATVRIKLIGRSFAKHMVISLSG